MTEDVVPLDGNAAAGPLATLFAVEPTMIIITCEGCGREGPLATLKLYGGPVGLVLRCPACDMANVRYANTGTSVTVDLRGSARLTAQGGPERTGRVALVAAKCALRESGRCCTRTERPKCSLGAGG